MFNINFGIILGSLLMVICLLIYLFFDLKFKIYKKKILKYKENKNYNIDKKICNWSKFTKTKYINSSVFKYNSKKTIKTNGVIFFKGGIGVVSIQSISGKILGNSNSKKWTKINDEEVNEIDNHIMENDKKIQEIQKMINLKIPIFSIIIYFEKLESINIQNKPSHVVFLKNKNLYKKLNAISSTLEPLLTKRQIKKIFKDIVLFKTKKVVF